MTEQRYVKVDGSHANCPSAFAKDIQAAHRWSISFAQALSVAEALWKIEDDTKFKWETANVLTQTPRGYCSTCGTGWAGFINCTTRSACKYVDDNLGNPSPELPPLAWPPLDRTPSHVSKAAAPVLAGPSLSAGGSDGWGTR